jgi:hypothetical protein
MLLTHWARPARKGTACIYPMHGFIGIQALDLSRDTPSYLHSSNSLALCDTLVLGCHRVHVRCRRVLDQHEPPGYDGARKMGHINGCPDS